MYSLPKQEARFFKSIRSILNKIIHFFDVERGRIEPLLKTLFRSYRSFVSSVPFLVVPGPSLDKQNSSQNVGLLITGPPRTDRSQWILNIFTFRPHQARTHRHQTRHLRFFGCIFHFPAIFFTFFTKMCFLPKQEAQFSKSARSIFNQKSTFSMSKPPLLGHLFVFRKCFLPPWPFKK